MTWLMSNGSVFRQCVLMQGKQIKPYKWTLFWLLHQNRIQKIIQYHDNKIWKRCVLKIYLVILRPIYNSTYKGGYRYIFSWELYITNWTYSNKVGIDFTLYNRIRSKRRHWDGTRPNQVYIAIKWRRHILVTQRNYMNCNTNRRNTLSPFSCSNRIHVTD